MSTIELDRVREYRRAARVAVRADHAALSDRYLALIDLADGVRAEQDPVVRRWAEFAIWEESRVFLGVVDEEHDFPPTHLENRIRALRLEGFDSCPRCLHSLPTEDDLERWRRIRAAHIEELRVREQAVDG